MREELGIPLVFSHKEVGQACKIKPMLADADVEGQDGGDPVLIEVRQEDSDEEIDDDDEFVKPDNLTAANFAGGQGDESKLISSHHVSTIVDNSISMEPDSLR